MQKERISERLIRPALLVIAAIFVISMTTSCCTTPVTPRLPVPEKPDFPKLTDDELQILTQCTADKAFCIIPRSIVLKYDDKVLLYRVYARECMAVIEANNKQAE